MSAEFEGGTEGGHGEHRPYFIKPSPVGADHEALTPHEHYVGVDAITWFVNKKSNWWKNRVASGTLEITLNGGTEAFEVGLGTYDLDRGARTAPVYQRVVLPDRNFLGGPITFKASLTSIENDSGFASILRNAAKASAGVVAGIVGTATATGLNAALLAAGREIVGGVETMLKDGKNRVPIFDFQGHEFTLFPEQVVGPETFLLLHRGADLTASYLSLGDAGAVKSPLYAKMPLEDGAWILLRIRREHEYEISQRPWWQKLDNLEQRIEILVSDVVTGLTDKNKALEEFELTATGNNTLRDIHQNLRTVIIEDYVISKRQRTLLVGTLNTKMHIAKQAISEDVPATYSVRVAELEEALKEGVEPDNELAEWFEDGVTNVDEWSVPGSSGEHRGLMAMANRAELFRSMSRLPVTLSELFPRED